MTMWTICKKDILFCPIGHKFFLAQSHGRLQEIIRGLLATELRSYRVTELQSHRVTDTQGYSGYGWVKFFCTWLRSQGGLENDRNQQHKSIYLIFDQTKLSLLMTKRKSLN